MTLNLSTKNILLPCHPRILNLTNLSTNNLIWFCIFLLFLNGKVYGQSEITGLILNEDQKPVLSASVILKDISGKIISYTFTNESGLYRLSTTKFGQFILIVSSLNFEQKKMDVTLEKNEFKKLDFNLISKVTELKEVIIKANRPIIVKKDTIIFETKSFLQGNEQVVEDLLKKIPGLNILPDGTIKVGNQEVEKVMIDGDDFFEKGYKILTKNMPVYPIDKVELYQNYANNKHLKGIEYSEKVALNLTLNEDSKHIWFGNATGEYGIISRDRYLLRTNVMNFGKKSKHYFLTNLNTIGDDAVGDINHLIRPFRFNEPGSIGDNQSASSILTLNYSLPNLAKRWVNLNHDKMLSLNSIYTLSDKIKIKTIGFLNTNKNDFFRNSYQEFMLGNLNFKNNEDFIGRKTQFVGFAKIDLTYDLTKSKTIEFTSKINNSNQNDRSDLLFNNDEINERLHTSNQLFDQKIVFTNRFKENKVFLLSTRYIDERTPQNYTINPNIFSGLFSQNTSETNQYSQNNMQFAGVEAHILNRKNNGDLLEIKFGNQLRIDKLNTSFELVENTKLSYPEGYQNKITYASNDLYLSATYNFKLSELNILSQSDFHQLTNHFINFDAKRSQYPFYVVPKIGVDWKMNEKNKIVGSYSYNTTNAGVLDVYSGYVQSGFRSIAKGLDQFNQLNSSNAILGYECGDWGDSFFAKTYILYSKNNDFFSTNSIVAQNYSKSEKIIVKDRSS